LSVTCCPLRVAARPGVVWVLTFEPSRSFCRFCCSHRRACAPLPCTRIVPFVTACALGALARHWHTHARAHPLGRGSAFLAERAHTHAYTRARTHALEGAEPCSPCPTRACTPARTRVSERAQRHRHPSSHRCVAPLRHAASCLTTARTRVPLVPPHCACRESRGCPVRMPAHEHLIPPPRWCFVRC
jgi:hypothetical protein